MLYIMRIKFHPQRVNEINVVLHFSPTNNIEAHLDPSCFRQHINDIHSSEISIIICALKCHTLLIIEPDKFKTLP